MVKNSKNPEEYTEKELLQRIAMWNKKTSDDVNTIKKVFLFYFALTIIGFLVTAGFYILF